MMAVVSCPCCKALLDAITLAYNSRLVRVLWMSNAKLNGGVRVCHPDIADSLCCVLCLLLTSLYVCPSVTLPACVQHTVKAMC